MRDPAAVCYSYIELVETSIHTGAVSNESL